MYPTEFGRFDGRSWERLCQKVFKRKYVSEIYQPMPASPGDFGIEGFTRKTGLAFQCYCPDSHVTSSELYENQRDKMTSDLPKLRTYQEELAKRLGETKIKQWIFVTPECNRNKLLKHAEVKRKEVVGWGLSIIDEDFKVVIHDVDFYRDDFVHICGVGGSPIALTGPAEEKLAPIPHAPEYIENIKRKSKARLSAAVAVDVKKIDALISETAKKWLDGNDYFLKMSQDHPDIYQDVNDAYSLFDELVKERQASWVGDPGSLYISIRKEFSTLIDKHVPHVSAVDRAKIAEFVMARWLAICTVDFVS